MLWLTSSQVKGFILDSLLLPLIAKELSHLYHFKTAQINKAHELIRGIGKYIQPGMQWQTPGHCKTTNAATPKFPGDLLKQLAGRTDKLQDSDCDHRIEA
ncbi:MAG TPA: hypothetical protein PKN86_03970, partial [Candidatus Obscuribacter sp.]|nr:hypothetical protein [Candidatus Obscuribacter sp.]